MHVENGRLAGVTYKQAHAFGGEMKAPKFIVLHDTASGLRKGGVCEYFASSDCKVSAHFVIDRDGTITQMVPLDRRAYHAGVSSWKGISGLNSCSIGIEIVNPGKLNEKGEAWFGKAVDPSQMLAKSSPNHGSGFWLPYTPAQVKSVTEICRALVEEYEDCNEIVTHWMISPGRKIDVNPTFPMAEVIEAVFDPKPGAVVEPVPPPPPPPTKEPTRTTEAVKSKSIWTIFMMILGKILDFFFDLMGMAANFIEGAIQIIDKSQTEALGLIAPVTSFLGMLKLNLTGIVTWGTIAIFGVLAARHLRDKVRLARANKAAGTDH